MWCWLGRCFDPRSRLALFISCKVPAHVRYRTALFESSASRPVVVGPGGPINPEVLKELFR